MDGKIEEDILNMWHELEDLREKKPYRVELLRKISMKGNIITRL